MRAMYGAPGSQGYHQLGVLAQARGDVDGATRGYQRCLDISGRLGKQPGILETERGRHAGLSVHRHLQALAIRLGPGVPQAVIDLHQLAVHRAAMGTGLFTSMLTEAVGADGTRQILSPCWPRWKQPTSAVIEIAIRSAMSRLASGAVCNR